jgi:hypothetical protein
LGFELLVIEMMEGRALVELANKVYSRHTIQLGHDDVLYEKKPSIPLINEPKTPNERTGNVYRKRKGIKLTINTKSYFSRSVLFTATPTTVTSVVHRNTFKGLLLSCLLTASSSTRRTLGGTAQPGTNVDKLTGRGRLDRLLRSLRIVLF